MSILCYFECDYHIKNIFGIIIVRRRKSTIDPERKIRFLYPPFFLLASLLLGLYFDPNRSLNDILPIMGSDWIKVIVGALIGGGLIVIVAGFFIGTISLCILRLAFKVFGKRQHEAVLSQGCLEQIWKQLHATGAPCQNQTLYAAATFDHELLPKGIHDWLTRRWNAFNISVNSGVAFALALIIGKVLSIDIGIEWCVTSVIVAGFLTWSVILAWRDTMGMIEFQSHREPKNTDQNGGNGGDA